MRSKWIRYSSSSASRSPSCARSTSARTRAGASGRSLSVVAALTEIGFPAGLAPEPHARLAAVPLDVDDPAQREREAAFFGLERDRSLPGSRARLRARDRALELVGGAVADKHAQ